MHYLMIEKDFVLLSYNIFDYLGILQHNPEFCMKST